MTYIRGKSNAIQRNYRVFVRTHKTPETITTDNQMLALIGYASLIGLTEVDITTDGVNDEDLITTANRLYNVSTYGEDGSFDFRNASPEGSAEADLIILKLVENESGAYEVDVYDEAGTLKTLKTEGSYIVLSYDLDNTRWVHFCAFNAVTGSPAISKAEELGSFRELGACEEKPTMNGTVGEEKRCNWGDYLTLSEILNVSIKDMEVTKDNYAYLRSFLTYNDGAVDFIFCDITSVKSATIANDMKIKPLPEFTGNDINYLNIEASKEDGDIDNHFDIHEEVS